MRPDHRKLVHAKRQKKNRSLGLIYKLLIPILVIISIFVFVKLTTKYWNNNDKLSFTFTTLSGDVEVTVLDPVLKEMTTIKIPAETEVNVARNYGTLRIKNVWKLSQNEKLGGKLLPETITQTFLFPTILWTDTNLNNVFKFIFFPKDTNIPFGDRLSVGIFYLKIRDLDKTEIDMAKSQFLKKEKLSDGQIGYHLVNGISERLGVYFSDNEMANKNLRVSITDASGKFGLAQLVGQIIEVMGGKIVSIDKKQNSENFDCQVLGSNKNINKKVATLFSCKIVNEKTDFDLEIRMGLQFAKRF